jgi:hypothetical protein
MINYHTAIDYMATLHNNFQRYTKTGDDSLLWVDECLKSTNSAEGRAPIGAQAVLLPPPRKNKEKRQKTRKNDKNK